MPFRNWKPLYSEIIHLYESGNSPADISKIYNTTRTTIKNIIINKSKLRNKSEAAKLAVKQGKKDKAIKALIEIAKTTNRFNPKKGGLKGELHHRWIKDRTKLKQKRCITEEKVFFKELIEKRKYKCELTNIGGSLSVHHIKGVWEFPSLKYDESNCIVILNKIHKKFHKMYGYRANENDWNFFVKNKEYLDNFLFIKKKNYIPFDDKTNKKFGKLFVLRKVDNKWECQCECGVIKLIYSSNIKKTISCGCLKKSKKCIKV